jgi:predicted AlkP superfamily pyrophosphatase or phosphodiesterase
MRHLRPLLAVIIVTIAAGEFALSTGQQRQAPVVLISIDGLKPEYVTEADKHGMKIPNLRRFLTEGAFASGVIGVLPTVTYPSHTTLVTGVSPTRHGIVGNTPFDPFAKNLSGWYWYAEDVKAQTLWEAVRKRGLVTASVDWPATVSANINFSIPQYWRAGNADDHKLLREVATTGLLDEIERVVGSYPMGKDYSVEADEKRVLFDVYLLERKRPAFQTVYFGGLDHVQHDTGPFSVESKAALERIDALVGRVRAAAEKSGGGRAVICIASDHGFAEVTHELRLNVALKNAGLIDVAPSGNVRSWKAYSWSSGGSSAIYLEDPNDNALREKVRSVLAAVAASSENGVLKVYEGQQLKALDGFPDAAFAVGVKPGFQIGGSLDGPLIRNIALRGTHGFLPEVPEMRSSFFIAGPRVPRAKNFGTIDMRDIAPTLASLLNVRLPAAEGRDLLLK